MENTILSFLFHSTLLFSILFAGIWLIKKAFSRHLSALLQYVLWIIVVMKLFLPVGLPSELSPWNLFQSSGESVVLQQNEQSDSAQEGLNPAGMQGIPSQYRTGMAEGIAEEQPSGSDNTQTQEKAGSGSKTLNWYYTAVYVWASGMLAMLGWLIICAAQIRWKIALNEAGPVPDWTLHIFEECKKELGIKRDVGLVVQHVFPIPAITGVLKPLLILPVQIISGKDGEQMKHILLHELTHYKNGDIIATYLLNVLNAVYWFNPLVWLCCKLIRKDMEVLCDTRVIDRLGKENRQAYIHTILRFSQLKHTPGLTPAMSLNDGRVTMQKRILGMFGCKRTKTRIKIPVLLICMSIVFACFTTACQPAPVKQPVIGRVELEKKVEMAEPVAIYEAPGSWQETLDLQDSGINVEIDAKLTIPDAEAYPVYKAQKAVFSQDQIDKLLAFFLKDRKVLKDPVMTKSDYVEEIKEAKKGQLIDGQYVVTDESEAWAAQLEEMMQNAPETSGKEYITDFHIKSGDVTYGVVELGNGKYGNIFFTDNLFSITNGGYPEPEAQIVSQGKEGIGGTYQITAEEAAAASQKILDTLGIIGMTPQSIEKARFYPQTNVYMFNEEKPESKGYYIKYVREIGGIQTQLIERWNINADESFSYLPPWEDESIYVYVDEFGNMQQFSWFNPLRVTEKVSDNADLLPFDELQERMRKELSYNLTILEGYGNMSISVDRLELKMAMINVQDNPDEAMYVPAWYVHYTLHAKSGNTYDEGSRQTEMADNERLMILNAIDGGSIAAAPAPFLEKISAASETTAQEAAQPVAEPVPAEAAPEAL